MSKEIFDLEFETNVSNLINVFATETVTRLINYRYISWKKF